MSTIAEAYARSRQSVSDGLCGCHRCLDERDEFRTKMVVCPTCGNKRCPKATDHRLECTGRNEPGQEGSAYGKAAP